MNKFNLKSFLTENALTPNSKLLKETTIEEVEIPVNEDIEAFSDTIQVVGYPKTVEDALKVIERYERDRDPVSREEAKEIIADMRATDDDDFDRNITRLIEKAFNIKLKGISEKKGNLKERNDIVSTQDLDAAAAFKDAGIDMSQPVLVLTQDGGHGGQETKGTVSAENALNMFNNLRAQALELGKEDHYEFDNEIGFSAEGYEYKIAYFEEESTTTALMQKASGEVEEAWGFQSDFAKHIEKNGGAPTAKADPKVLQVSMGKNAEQEQRVIDIAKAAIGLMDEQPGTRAEEALKSVLGI